MSDYFNTISQQTILEFFQEYLPFVLGHKISANSVDLDQTPQNAASDLCLHYYPVIQPFLDT